MYTKSEKQQKTNIRKLSKLRTWIFGKPSKSDWIYGCSLALLVGTTIGMLTTIASSPKESQIIDSADLQLPMTSTQPPIPLK